LCNRNIVAAKLAVARSGAPLFGQITPFARINS
jgi:hypothetical protein